MKLLFTTPTYAPHKGGAESFLADLARMLVAEGCQVTVVTARLSASLPARELRDGVRVRRLEYPPRQVSARRAGAILVRGSRLVLGLLAALHQERPQVVCVGLVGIETLVVLLARRLVPFRLVVYLHGGELRVYARVSPLLRWTLRALLDACDAAIAVSPVLAEEAAAFQPRVRGKLAVLPTGVDLAAFGLEAARPHPRPYVLYVGRLLPAKGVETLIEAFGRIAARAPSLDLLIAGSGSDTARLRARVAAGGLDGRVRFLGDQERAQVAALLGGCELLVLPSVSEGRPLVVLEAMAAGALVIGSRVVGIEELIEDGRTGLLFGPGDASALAALLLEYARDPERRQPLVARARAVSAAFDLQTVVPRHLAVLTGRHERLRVCLLSLFFDWDPSCAGVATFYATLARALAALGHDVTVITLADRASATASGRVVPIALPRRALVEQIGADGLLARAGRAGARLAFSLRAYQAVLRLERAGGLDVVIAPELFAQGLFVALFRPSKLVTRVHTPTHVVDRYNRRPRPLVSRLLALAERVQTARSRAVSVASRRLAVLLEEEWRIPARRLRVIPNAVEVARVRDLAAAQPRLVAGEYLLFVGRLEPRKGVDILSEALHAVFAARRDLRMVFVGPDRGLRAGIRRAHARQAERMLFFDALEQPRLFGLVRHARLVVLPSLYENMSNAALEAMALERPVVGTRGTAFEELIEDGVSGFLAPPGDAAALSDCILAALARPDLVRIGEHAGERACQLEARVMAAQHARVCQEVASAP